MKNSVDPAAETTSMHDATGQHLLLTLKRCESFELLNDEQQLIELAGRAAEATGATIMNVCSQKFSPQGITIIAVLAESHASLHTYPESGVVFWDCFTCGTTCKPEKSIAVLTDALKPGEVDQQVVHRG